MTFYPESKDACHRVSIGARNVREAIRQKTDSQEIRAQFLALAEDVATLVETLRRNQSDIWSLLEGEYCGLFSAVMDTLNDAARRKLTHFADLRRACDEINDGLCTIQYLKHSRPHTFAAGSCR